MDEAAPLGCRHRHPFRSTRKPAATEFSHLCATPRTQHFRDLCRLNQRNVIPQAPFRSRSVLVPPPVAVLSGGAKTYNPRGIPKVTRQKPPRGRERPHFARLFAGQNPCRLRGSLPATGHPALRVFLGF